MTIPNHIILGLIIGKLTGNYELAVTTSVLVDCDHFVSLYKHDALKSFKSFWKAESDPEDPWGDQRGVLHTLFSVILTTSLSYFLFSPMIALIVGLSHFGHIFLDAISDSDSWPFRPFSNFRIRGFIPYYSKYEVLFFVGLLLIFFVV
jgi:membrane-bound metal-dependent hydrolase YbcI (DUF457 family)